MTIDAPRELRIRADELAANDHSTMGATETHHLVGGQLWRTFRALGYTEGVVLGAGDGAVPMVGIPEMDQASEDSVVADLDSQHRPRRPVQDLEAWPGGEDFDVVITALAGYDVRLTYKPNIVRRRADQLEAALLAVYFTRPGGLTALVATHDLMDNPIPFGRRHLADMADLVGAVRLPAGTYRQTAGTDEVADLLMFRRRAWHERRRGPDFENAPGIYLDGEMVTVNTYFDTNVDQVLGTIAYDPTGQPSMNVTVTGTPERFAPALADAMDFVIATGQHHDLTMKPHGAVLHSLAADIRTHRASPRRLRTRDAAQPDAGPAGPAGRYRPAGPEIGT